MWLMLDLNRTSARGLAGTIVAVASVPCFVFKERKKNKTKS